MAMMGSEQTLDAGQLRLLSLWTPHWLGPQAARHLQLAHQSKYSAQFCDAEPSGFKQTTKLLLMWFVLTVT